MIRKSLRLLGSPGTGALKVLGRISAGGAGIKKILIVDDDALVARTIGLTLERRSFQIAIADGGKTGLDALESSLFDMMIVDIFMPHMRGFEAIRIFHQRAPTIPLIAISGYAFEHGNEPAPDLLRIAIELGAVCCLRKPFTPAALLTAVNRCMDGVELDAKCEAEGS